MRGKGTVFLTYEVVEHGKQAEQMSRLDPVFYIPRLSIRLLSLGVLLTDGLTLRGTKSKMTLYKGSSMQMQLNPHHIGDTLFWLQAWVTPAANLLAKSTVYSVDYGLLHRRFGHPSKEVLCKASKNTSDFPKDIIYPKNNPICQGCVEGKMPSASFPPSQS